MATVAGPWAYTDELSLETIVEISVVTVTETAAET